MVNSLIGYKTRLGKCVAMDSRNLLQQLDDDSIDLIVTSPPFSLQRKKEYGNVAQNEYVDWLCEFGKLAFRKLKKTGSFVIDIGSAYEKGVPVYSLYQFRVLIRFCDELGYNLAQPFYWHNSSALPAPIEWVNKRKLRAKNSVNTIWWFSKDPYCKANVSKVLTPYSSRMQKLIENPADFVKAEGAERPSGHVMNQSSWARNNGGAIPPNLLQVPNSESNSAYLRFCKKLSLKGHPARFPAAIPEFFIKFLTEENDTVLDIFSGSNTTGQVAENLGRRWLSCDISKEYVASSVFRFSRNEKEAELYYNKILNNEFINIHSLL